MKEREREKIEHYGKGAYDNFAPFIVTITGTPSINSRKALRAFVNKSIASTGRRNDDDDLAGRITSAIRLRAAFTLMKAIVEELFRNPERTHTVGYGE